TPKVDINKLEINTPITIPQKYLRLKTIKWLKISETLNWIFVKPNGAISAVTAMYKAASIPFVTNGLIFICYALLSFLSWEVLEPRKQHNASKFSIIYD